MDKTTVLGISNVLKNNLWLINEETLLFSSGFHLILQPITGGPQKLINFTTKTSEPIKGIWLMSNRRYVVVAIKSSTETKVIVEVIDMLENREKSTLKTNLTDCNHLTVSAEGKFILITSDKRMEMWSWEQSSMLASLDSDILSTIRQITFNTRDSGMISAIQGETLRFWKYSRGTLEGFTPINLPHATYSTHVWLGESSLLIASENGALLHIQDFETPTEVNINSITKERFPKSNFPPNAYLTVVTCGVKKVIGGTNQGTILIWPREGKKILWDSVLRIRPKEMELQTNCLSISVGSNELSVVCATDKGQILSAKTAPTDNFESTAVCITQFHRSPIKRISAVPQTNSLFMHTQTSLSLWNYQTRHLIVHKNFHETLRSASINPQSGLQLAVAHADCLRLYLATYQCLVTQATVKQLENPSEVLFSANGHLLACVYNNSSEISVVSTINFQIVSTIRANQSIQLLCWTVNESIVYTTATGVISCADVKDGGSPLWKFQQKPLQFLQLQPDKNDNCVWALCSDCRLNRFENGKIVQSIFISNELPNCFALNAVEQLLTLGMRTGHISCRKLENNEDICIPMLAHSSEVTQMCFVDMSKGIIATGAKDGSIILWTMKGSLLASLTTVGANELIQETELVLVQRELVVESDKKYQKIEDQLKEFQADKLYQEDAILHKHKQETEALCDQFEAQIASLQAKVKVSESEKDQLLSEQEQIIEELRKTYTEEFDQQMEKHHSEMASEINRYKELESLHDSLVSNYENRLVELQTRTYSNTQSIKDFYEAKINEAQRRDNLMQNQLERLESAQKNVNDQLSGTISDSRDQLWETYNNEAARLKDMILALTTENEVLQRKLEIAEVAERETDMKLTVCTTEKATLQAAYKDKNESNEAVVSELNRKLQDLTDKKDHLEQLIIEKDSSFKNANRTNEELSTKLQTVSDKMASLEQAAQLKSKETAKAVNDAQLSQLKLINLMKSFQASQKDTKRTQLQNHHILRDLRMLSNQIQECKNAIQNPKLLKELVLLLSGTMDKVIAEHTVIHHYTRSQSTGKLLDRPSKLPPLSNSQTATGLFEA